MARCVISLLIAALLLLPAIARAADTVAMRVPILVYHRFGAPPASRSVVITVDAQIAGIKQAYFSASAFEPRQPRRSRWYER
jgi:hypothetical protein